MCIYLASNIHFSDHKIQELGTQNCGHLCILVIDYILRGLSFDEAVLKLKFETIEKEKSGSGLTENKENSKISIIKTIYEDPKVGITGINDFQRKLKERNIKVSQNKIKDFLETQDGYTKHKPVIKKYETRRFYSPRIDAIWQADIGYFIDFPEANDNYKYWLVVIDTFSKFSWLKHLKSKSMQETTKAFEDILRESNRTPSSLNTDNGTEFIGTTFQLMLKKHKIHWYGTNNEGKAMICERLIGTLKRKISLYMTTHNTHRWIDVFPDIIHNYNYNTIHSTIKLKPSEASKKENESEVYIRLYEKKHKFKTPKFQAGDTVRIYKYANNFKKSFTPNFTNEFFNVPAINPGIH